MLGDPRDRSGVFGVLAGRGLKQCARLFIATKLEREPGQLEPRVKIGAFTQLERSPSPDSHLLEPRHPALDRPRVVAEQRQGTVRAGDRERPVADLSAVEQDRRRTRMATRSLKRCAHQLDLEAVVRLRESRSDAQEHLRGTDPIRVGLQEVLGGPTVGARSRANDVDHDAISVLQLLGGQRDRCRAIARRQRQQPPLAAAGRQ